MEADCKALIDKYVRSDSVIACLELSGYTSSLLIRNLDSNQIDQIEEFVRHACTVMSPIQSRTFLGNVFSCHADKFCFPIGVRMGLMLAVNELKTLASNTSGSHNNNNSNNNNRRDKSLQTDISIGCSFSSFVNPNLHFLNKLSSNALMMCEPPQMRSGTDLSCSSTPKSSSIDQASDTALDGPEQPVHPMQPQLPIQQQQQQHKRASLNPAISDINIDHLKQHSSASAVRLASRQFVNAHLVQHRHFQIEMELSGGPSADGSGAPGPTRVTGIFHCHLCRQKRDRSTPVRFSIARNRYPVMSNVLSHLKIHFQPIMASSSSHHSPSLSSSIMSHGNGANGGDDTDGMAIGGMVKQEHRLLLTSGGGGGNSQMNIHPNDYSLMSPFNLDQLIMPAAVVNGNGSIAAPPGIGVDMKMFPSGTNGSDISGDIGTNE